MGKIENKTTIGFKFKIIENNEVFFRKAYCEFDKTKYENNKEGYNKCVNDFLSKTFRQSENEFVVLTLCDE